MIFLVQFGINKYLYWSEKFTRAYLFQIALEIMWLPIQISQILHIMLKGDGFSAKSLGKRLLHGPTGQFWLTEIAFRLCSHYTVMAFRGATQSYPS